MTTHYCKNCGKQILKGNIIAGAVSVQCEHEKCGHTQIVSAAATSKRQDLHSVNDVVLNKIGYNYEPEFDSNGKMIEDSDNYGGFLVEQL